MSPGVNAIITSKPGFNKLIFTMSYINFEVMNVKKSVIRLTPGYQHGNLNYRLLLELLCSNFKATQSKAEAFISLVDFKRDRVRRPKPEGRKNKNRRPNIQCHKAEP